MGGGASIEEAADLCGIPQPEAIEWAQKRLENVGATQSEMHAVALASLKIAMEHLEKIVTEGPRFSATEYSEEGKPVRSVTPQNVDVEAAKALASLAIAAAKLAGTGRAPAEQPAGKGGRFTAQLDLWDGPGNWNLSTPK